MNLILVSIGNFQEYILDNIKQLLRLEISNIYVITNSVFFDKFDLYKDKINLIAIETLNAINEVEEEIGYHFPKITQVSLELSENNPVKKEMRQLLRKLNFNLL